MTFHFTWMSRYPWPAVSLGQNLQLLSFNSSNLWWLIEEFAEFSFTCSIAILPYSINYYSYSFHNSNVLVAILY